MTAKYCENILTNLQR